MSAVSIYHHNDPQAIARHISVRAPSMQRIVEMCNEAVANDWTWWEFKTRLQVALNTETREIRHLEKPLV
jgi:hypothetical protein